MPATKPARTASDFALKARSAGYLAAMHGKDIEACPYHSIAMQDSWVAGYKEYQQRMRTIKK